MSLDGVKYHLPQIGCYSLLISAWVVFPTRTTFVRNNSIIKVLNGRMVVVAGNRWMEMGLAPISESS